MPICPKCNTEQPEGLNFCAKCGAPLGPYAPSTKTGAVKALILGGCGCVTLISFFICIVIVLALVMMNMQRQGPAAGTPIPPAQQPGSPTQPGTREPYQYPELKEGDVMLLFAKEITENGLPIDVVTTFSPNDPQIVLVIKWGQNTFKVGSQITWLWFYSDNTVLAADCYTVGEGYNGVCDKVKRPENGFSPGEYTVMVALETTPVATHSFKITE